MGNRKKSVAIIAAENMVSERVTDKSLEEMVFATTKRALDSVGLTAEMIDSFVISGQDQIDGRIISIMMGTGPSGGVNKDTTLTASSAEHALIYGYLRILAGQAKTVLVAGWSKPSESKDPDRAELMSAEPFILRAVGMNHTIAAAMQASKWISQGHDKSTSTDTLVWPLAKGDVPLRGDSVYAFILSAEDVFAQEKALAWIHEAGWATGNYEMGDRDLSDLSSLSAALQQIRRRTPEVAESKWSAVEIASDSEYAVRAVCRQLNLRSETKVNPSGSLATIPTSPFVAGLARMFYAVKAIKSQSNPSALVAGIGFNGYAGQGASIMVFSGAKEL